MQDSDAFQRYPDMKPAVIPIRKQPPFRTQVPARRAADQTYASGGGGVCWLRATARDLVECEELLTRCLSGAFLRRDAGMKIGEFIFDFNGDPG
jgi:hypothetical protein